MNTLSFAAFALLITLPVPASAAPPPSAATESARPSINVSQLTPTRYELVYSGTTFTSRDQIEGDLLLSAARLALAHDEQWFVLLAMPGERPDVHPTRPNPAFGAKYGHWQPHWNYDLPQYGWQWWHPEWGADFWTKDVDPKIVDGIEVHAMIDLGQSASPLDDEVQLNAKEVIQDLTSPSRVTLGNARH